MLTKNGIAWDTAISMDGEERMALAIVFGTLDGGKFDWSAGRWVDQGNA